MEENLFQFHLANLEHSCGTILDNVSAIHYDQSEVSSQSGGPIGILPGGFASLLRHLARGIDIRLNTQVTEVNYSDSGVMVVTYSGAQLHADHVLVTVPLTALKRHAIQFNPPLPDEKIHAIESFGIGVLEKVILHFPHRFWTAKVGGSDFFGRVPEDPSSRGLFTIFHDISSKSCESGGEGGVLVTFLSAEAASIVRQKSDMEIVNLCIAALKKLFPDEANTIKPQSYVVTRWQEDPFAGMAYSYIPVGRSGEIYDQLAAPVANKVFFAGEATNRAYPQTVTGAYLSGLREVRRMLDMQLNELG